MPNSFDRTPAPTSGSATKKYAFAGLLAACLGGVLFYNYVRMQPRAAGASVMGQAVAALDHATVPTESPSEVLASLARDPTADLLRGMDAAAVLEEPPSNPFAVSPQWLAALVKTPAPVSNGALPTVNSVPVKIPAGHFDPGSLKLQGLFKNTQGAYALLNGVVATPGTVVGGVRVIEVQDDRLICQPVGYPDSARFELLLKGRAP